MMGIWNLRSISASVSKMADCSNVSFAECVRRRVEVNAKVCTFSALGWIVEFLGHLLPVLVRSHFPLCDMWWMTRSLLGGGWLFQ